MSDEDALRAYKRATQIAILAHEGQRDHSGSGYITHPMRVAAQFTHVGDGTRAIVAMLHDVVEDSNWTLERLRDEGFAPEVLEAVDALTRREGEAYPDFIARCAANPIAKPVKIADIRDNMDAERLAKLGPKTARRLIAKYSAALLVLEA